MIVLVLVVRVTIGLVFVRAGLLKAFNAGEFKQAVVNYRLLPARGVALASYGLIFVEIVGGCLLLLGVELRPTGIILSVLLVVFGGAIAINLGRGRTISCGCSSSVAADISWPHVGGNGALAAAAGVIAIRAAEPLSLLPGVPDIYRTTAWTDRAIAWILLLALAAAGALLWSETRRARHAFHGYERKAMSS